MKTLILALLLAFSATTTAGIYKCTKPGGGIAYQNKPCMDGQNRQELIVPDKRPSGSYETPWYKRDGGSSYTGSTTRSSYSGNDKYDDAINKIDNRNCQLYMDWLEEAKDEWNNVKKQGYKTNQKTYHMQRIKNAERDVRRECN